MGTRGSRQCFESSACILWGLLLLRQRLDARSGNEKVHLYDHKPVREQGTMLAMQHMEAMQPGFTQAHAEAFHTLATKSRQEHEPGGEHADGAAAEGQFLEGLVHAGHHSPRIMTDEATLRYRGRGGR